MYDLSSEMNDFYEDHVRVKQSVYDDLRDKKDKNITRLESGLEDYNEENETTYSILDKKEQGSVAMATIVQNDDKDYDIDVGIIFDEGNIAYEIVQMLAEKKGIRLSMEAKDYHAFKESQYDKLADMIREHMDMEQIYDMLGELEF